MDPVTGIAILAGVSLASLAGLRLKKDSQEGFAVLPATQGTESYPGSVDRSQTRYNQLASMIDPANNSLIPVGSPASLIDSVRQKLLGAFGSQEAAFTKSNPLTLKLQQMANKYPVRADGQGSLFEGIKFCQDTGKLEQPFGIVSSNGIWKFSEHCGVCLNGGVDEYGKPFRGTQGMILDPSARLAATTEKESKNYPYVQIGPSIGTCAGAPGSPVFAVNQQDLTYFSKRLACLTKKNIDPAHKCGVCYGSTNFYYVDSNAEVQPVYAFLRGLGTARVFVNDVAVGEPLTLSETVTQRVELTNIREGTKFSITVDNPTTGGLASLFGYFQSTNPNGGLFTMPLNVLFIIDDETQQLPVKAGGFFTFRDLNLETAKMRPATGKTRMRLRGTLPFTFLDANEPAAYDCPAAPYQTKTESLSAFAQDQPCFAKGSGPGNYSAECLQARILEAGCTNQGTLYANPLSLNVDQRGQPRDLNAIYTYLSDIASKDLLEEGPTKQCSGRTIISPCDAFTTNTNLSFRTTPGARACLSYLYNNQGKGKAIGPTYNASTEYANKMNQMANLFCLPSGLLNPEMSEEAYQRLAVVADNGYTDSQGVKKTRVEAVKSFLSDRINLAINTSIDANTDLGRKQAIRDCFGPDLRNLPTGLFTNPTPVPTSCGYMARYVRIIPQQIGTQEVIQIGQLVVINSAGQNISVGKTASASGQWASETPPSRAVDGNETSRNYPMIYHSEWNFSKSSYWMVDLGRTEDITAVIYYNRADCCSERSNGQTVQLLDDNKNVVAQQKLTGKMEERIEFRNTALGPNAETCRYDQQTIPAGQQPGLYAYYYGITKDVPDKDPYTSTSGWKGDALLKQGPVTSLQLADAGKLPRSERVGLVLKGYYNAPGSGWVRFRFSYDDGFMLIFNNQPVSPDDWKLGPDRTTETSQISIPQAGAYPIEIRYFQNYGGADFYFFWQSNTVQSWQSDLSKRFSYDTTASTPRAIPAPAPVFKQTKLLAARGGMGGSQTDMICPEGSFVNRITGSSSDGRPNQGYVKRIGVSCTNGRSFGPVGGSPSGGLPFDTSSTSGFRRLDVRAGSLVDRVDVYTTQNTLLASSGGYGGGPSSLDCGPDEKLMGLKVRAGSLIDNIQPVCGKPM